ncbi:MAG TPA: ATP-binding protein [Pseudonocardiaceae bacterium]
MPIGYEQTKLWTSCLAERPDDPDGPLRERLRVAYHGFRQRAAVLAAEIPLDLRTFTQHDVTHLDALWEMADLIVGDKITLTPAEAFVLGGAFLVHDLGMGLAAFPDGLEQLTTEAGWSDIVASTFHQLEGRPAEPDELTDPPAEVLRVAKETALREKHADRAAELALISWQASSGATYHLIEDVDLRNWAGRLIGRLAASHGWDLDNVAAEFSSQPLGALPGHPPSWVVEPLKLACLMRLADACHVDGRRAPGYLRAVRRPPAAADLHWIFQERLHRPTVQDDAIVYTSGQSFAATEAAPWWLCFETLQMIDGELSAVDALLLDCGRPRFALNRVKGVDTPRRLSDLVPTDGWIPVDARVVVTDAPKLVAALGGEQLYGDDLNIPLRELIQNATDANRALRMQVPDAPRPTVRVTLRLAEDEAWWLCVEDNGIGMSSRVLSTTLLDFGRSYWGSQLMRQEHPGLAASGFRATGRYGIGFYSVFMLGDEVRVVSRRYDEASRDTMVLEFADGLISRPVLRPARHTEIKHSGGTTVSVRLHHPPYSKNGLIWESEHPSGPLHHLCGWLAPAIDSDLLVQENDGPPTLVVKAEDWRHIDAVTLLSRIASPVRWKVPASTYSIDELARRVRTIGHQEAPAGRAALAPTNYALIDANIQGNLAGVVVAGGLRLGEISRTVGIFLANPSKADRKSGRLDATEDALTNWASTQAEIYDEFSKNEPLAWLEGASSILSALAADTAGTYVCLTKDGPMDVAALTRRLNTRQHVLVTSVYDVDFKTSTDGFRTWDERSHQELTLHDDVIVLPGDHSAQLGVWFDLHPDRRWHPTLETGDEFNSRQWWYYHQRSIESCVIKAAVSAWGVSLDEVLDSFEYLADEQVPVGDIHGTGECQAMAEWRITRPS